MSPIGITPARAGRRPTSTALSLAALTALTAAACGDGAVGTLSTRAGYSLDHDDIPVSMCPDDDEARLSDDEGALVGPHFALRVECVASFTEPPEGYQTEYLFGEDATLFPPAEGYEFTMVQFAADPGREPLFEAEAGLSAVLAIGDREWAFDGEVPAPGSAYLAVVEQGAPVSLSVTDAERVQAIDLRERVRSDLVQALYNGSRTEVATDFVSSTVDASTTTAAAEYWVDDWTYSTNFFVSRSVYEPEAGWLAEPDRAVLSISFVWLHSGSGLVWEIDPEEALVVTGPDGELEAAAVDHVSEDWEDDGELRYYYLDYDVPADALEFDLVFAPRGTIAWPEHDVDLKVDTGFDTHELTADFS